MYQEQQKQKFRFLSFNEWVPDPLRLFIYIFFLTVFQFSNGIYFSAMNQMSGGLSVTMNDVKMLSHTMLIGMTMFFPLAFRLKFRFTNRTCLIVASLVLTACNLIVPHVSSVPVIMLICFIAGFFRLFGTFECFSSMLPKITPTYNYAIFLSFVFFVVLGVIHIFDIISTYIIYYYRWEYIHYMAVMLLLLVTLAAIFLMRPFRQMPKMKLYGIDLLGMILWSIFILSLIFVTQYGNQLDWLHSPFIRIAIGVAFIALGFNIGRLTYIRHPFLDFPAFKMKNLLNLLILFMFMGILLSAKNVLQNIFTAAVLHFDQLNSVSLKWFEFFGMFTGSVFSWYSLTSLKLSHKLLTFIGMSSIVVYIATMYFIISPYTNIEKLYFPIICCGFGHVVVFIALTVYAQATAPFKNYFQVLCILGLIRTGISSPIGDAVYTHVLKVLTSKYLATIDFYGNQFASNMDLININVLVSAIQELFGWSVLFGVIILILILVSYFKKDFRKFIPSLQLLYITLKKETK